MKIVFLLLALSVFCGEAVAQTYYGSTDVKTFRNGRDKEFRDSKESPLKKDDFGGFKGLNYFPVDKKFRVTAEFTRTPSEKYFEMPTSSGKTKKFVKYGVLKFILKGRPFTLSVYQIEATFLDKFPEYADLLFVPFKDTTSRTETYGGGRYIDIKTPKGKSVVLDFNVAYNPNCAYGSDKYNCPIPPSENILNVALRVGEKRYAYLGSEKVY